LKQSGPKTPFCVLEDELLEAEEWDELFRVGEEGQHTSKPIHKIKIKTADKTS